MESLQDLIIPVETSNLVMIIVGLAIVFLIISWLIWRVYFKTKSAKIRAIKKLKRLSKKQSATEERITKQNNRQSTAHSLSTILREGLEASNLSIIKVENDENWNTFRKDLESACYAKESLTQARLDDLFKQTLQWLKQP